MLPVQIGVVQYAVPTELDAAVTRAEAAVRQAAAAGARIISLPELFHAPYFCKRQEAARFDLALPLDGSVTQRMQRLAAELEVALVVPLFERQAAGVYRNSAVVIDADGGVLGAYRKMHIPDDPLFNEKYYFTPGDAGLRQSGFRVFRTRYATIGVLICWDQWYPEAARITALLGAQVLFYPTAIGWHPSEKAEFGAAQVDAWRTAQRAHAIANGLYVASANRVGFEPEPNTDGLEFFGHSFIADPFGRLLAERQLDEGALVATLDPALIETTRRNWPFLRDRRIDAYGPIVNRWLGDPNE